MLCLQREIGLAKKDFRKKIWSSRIIRTCYRHIATAMAYVTTKADIGDTQVHQLKTAMT